VLKGERRVELINQISHGFLEVSGLLSLNIYVVRCYQVEKYHTGFTLFAAGEEACVYVQMYKLPEGAEKMSEDLAFQMQGKGWGKLPKKNTLHLNIFPTEWTHAVSVQSPKRVIHRYQNPDRAVFIRYTGKSLQDPLLTGFNKHVGYLPGMWHTELASTEFFVHVASNVAPVSIVDALDLRVEQQAIRNMILDGVQRFASEQRDTHGDLYSLPVTGMVVWLDVGNGSISIHFDVRVPFEIDGSYSHQDYASLTRENWRHFLEHYDCGHKVTLTDPNGKAIKIAPGSDYNFGEQFGQLILNLVQTLREEKVFSALYFTSGAELIIEADDAAFSWPSIDEGRGKVNLL
jgi:hypothetical protein